MSDTTTHMIGRDRLFAPGKKRILTLDGGGTRGIISIMFLKRMETVLREQTGYTDLRLSDVFDLVAGTSVGSMIATMVSLGYEVDEIEARFNDLAPKIFSGRMTMFGQCRFDERPLVKGVRAIVQDETLGSDLLQTGLAIIAKRADTGSVWVLSNNPRMPYYEDGPEWDGNKRFKLASLIRASTAAPFLFTPSEISIHTDRFGNEQKGLFVDGGVSPHNNPALQMLFMAGLPAYHLNWSLTPEDLLMISVGTGMHRTPIDRREKVISGGIVRRLLGQQMCDDIEEAAFAAKTLQSIISDTSVLVLKVLQSVSHPRFSWRLNTEIGGLDGELLVHGLTGGDPDRELLRFQRYDVALEAGGLVPAAFDISATGAERQKMHAIDSVTTMPTLRRWGQEAAEKQVSAEDFAGFV
ncbi:MAG: patatin-like phospholipase family protein [Pseudomonadota bacterium]